MQPHPPRVPGAADQCEHQQVHRAEHVAQTRTPDPGNEEERKEIRGKLERIQQERNGSHGAPEVAQQTDPLPVGILFQDPNRPRYDTMTSQGLGMSVDEKIEGLNRALDVFAV